MTSPFLNTVLAKYLGVLLLLCGTVVALWPMQIYVLGTQVGGYPAVVYVLAYILDSNSVHVPQGLSGLNQTGGDITAAIARSVMVDAVSRTGIALMLIAAGVSLCLYGVIRYRQLVAQARVIGAVDHARDRMHQHEGTRGRVYGGRPEA